MQQQAAMHTTICYHKSWCLMGLVQVIVSMVAGSRLQFTPHTRDKVSVIALYSSLSESNVCLSPCWEEVLTYEKVLVPSGIVCFLKALNPSYN